MKEQTYAMPEPETLVDLLRWRAIHQPDRLAYTYLVDGEIEEVSFTYAELDQQARAIAELILNKVKAGERALLLYSPGLEYIAAFFGCLYAGVIAIPAYPPRPNRSISRLQLILSDAEATAVLTTGDVATKIATMLAQDEKMKSLQYLATDGLSDARGHSWERPDINGETLAFLQYTSGSTAAPKGVMVSHANLLQNQRTIRQAFRQNEESIIVGWLPLYHDMGLIGNIIHTLYAGGRCVFMAPAAFLHSPFRWLRAMSHYKATTAGAPNFAYELCVRKITAEQRATLDLSHWTVAINGAEPIRSATLDRFVETFGPCGFKREAFCPVYGLAEATLVVSGSRQGELPEVTRFRNADLQSNRAVAGADDEQETRQLVGCGGALLEQKIVIVDPETLTACPPGDVGEIWLSGPDVAKGYWNRAEVTQQIFGARLAESGEGPFLRTGDLGFLRQGQLYVTGRLKDMIIIRGQNHYPQDIELTAESAHPLLRQGCGAAFSVDDYGEERLVIVQELEHGAKPDYDQVIKAIRQAVTEEYALQVHAVVLIKAGAISKTSSGKIQRHACKARFLNSGFEPIEEWRAVQPLQPVTADAGAPEKQLINADAPVKLTAPSTAAIRNWLVAELAARLRIHPAEIDTREPFSRFGLDSAESVRLAGDLERWLGRQVPPTLAWNFPTIEAVAAHLSGEKEKVSISNSHDVRRNGDHKNRTEPIAIVGMACRFPGANDLESFWRLLRDGIDAIREVPGERWNRHNLYSPEPGAAGKMNTLWGGFLDQVDQFDPYFFGISPREAERMDPQQRLLLEIAWEALENAGQAPHQLAGAQTGVFIGISSADYSRLQSGIPELLDAYAGTGNAFSIAANRLSYFLDLRGPSLAIDTACSSSLVAMHLACQSLRQGECDMALAGGVNLILSPDLTIALSQARMMAGDGRCKTFDAEANGYVRGEGCGLIVLKRLSDAIRENDNIIALIRGSAVNQDGRSNGLTAPNGAAQEAILRQALRTAGVSPSQIDYIEAHGTGTPLGDPIEIDSLKAVLAEGRSSQQACWIGSVKTNIGHLEAAAGIAGVIKVALALKRKEIPKSLHLKTLNPHISLEGTALSVATETQPWLAQPGPRLAGVSSFGFGGTNAHAILEEAPETPPLKSAIERPIHILTVSAQSGEALCELARHYNERLASQPESSLADLCFTANTGRASFAHRLAVVCETASELREKLDAFVAGRSSEGIHTGEGRPGQPPEVVFLFTGQGSQYQGMGRRLYETQPAFREALVKCDRLLGPYLERSLLLALYSDSPEDAALLDQTAYAQPALFAIEYALAELWQSWGIKPAAVLGHSVGEYVAACVAGVFSLEEGLRLMAARGRLMQGLPEGGQMLSVFADSSRVAVIIAPYAHSVSIAAINSPENVVISGDGAILRDVIEVLKAQGVKSHLLKVSHAFHSPLLDPLLDDLQRAASGLQAAAPRIPLISNLTGRAVAAGELLDAEYWRRHARERVQFQAGIETLYEQGYRTFIEIGPNPALLTMAQQCLPGNSAVWLPSLRRGRDDWRPLLNSLSALHAQGAVVEWEAFDQDYARRKDWLPTYPFERQRCWPEMLDEAVPRKSAELSFHREDKRRLHPLVGRRVQSPLTEIIFEARIRTESAPFLSDHRVYERVVFPAAAYLEMALSAATEVVGDSICALEDVTIPEALLLHDGETCALQLILTPEEAGAFSFQVFSLRTEVENGRPIWRLHASGKIRKQQTDFPASTIFDEERLTKSLGLLSVESFYETLREQGIQYGQAFQALEELWQGEREALSQIKASTTEDEAYSLLTVVIDACFQTLGAALLNEVSQISPGEVYLPVDVERLQIHSPIESSAWCHVNLRADNAPSPRARVGDITIFDESGRVIAEIRGLRVARANREALFGETPEKIGDWLYEVDWREKGRQGDELWHLPPDYLPNPAQISQGLQLEANRLSDLEGLDRYAELLAGTDALSAAYIIDAFRRLGWKSEAGHRFSTDALAERLGVISMYNRLLQRLLEILAEDGLLARSGEEWQVCHNPARPVGEATEQLHQSLLARYPECEAELSLFERCGRQLASVLRGECDPLQLLFPSGSANGAAKLYQDSPIARVMNALTERAVTGLLAQMPSDRTVRILELGAGTGATTDCLLPKLPQNQTDYVFTDISPLFLRKAEERFSQYDFLHYRLLDLDRATEQQDFALHGFDVIVAANVLHATADLRETLRRIKGLLAPGGILVLLEATGRQRMLDLIFGLTDGWWRFADTNLRPSYPLLSQEAWRRLLEEEGFPEVEILTEARGPASVSQQALVLARGPALDERVFSHRGNWLIFADQGSSGRELAQMLAKSGQTCITVLPGQTYQALGEASYRINPSRVEDYHRALAETTSRWESRCRGIVHLWSLDSQALPETGIFGWEAETNSECRSLLYLVQAIAKAGLSDPPRLIVGTRNTQPAGATRSLPAALSIDQSTLWGLGKVIALEYPELRCKLIDLDQRAGAEESQMLLEELRLDDRELQVAFRGETRYVARLVRSDHTERDGQFRIPDGQPFRIGGADHGTLDQMKVQPLVRRRPGRGEVEIRVLATGLNFKDVLNALGVGPGGAGLLGGECAGRITAIGEGVEGFAVEDEVIAIAPDCFSSHVTISAERALAKPAHLTVEEGAGFQIAFLTAYYALNHLARLSRGERVLIHSAAGGVGLAAVQLAQRAGAEIFATAGSPQKREFLKSLGVQHVMDSRTLDFAEEVRELTGGKGVDVVLNSLSGPHIACSLDCCSAGGRFIEIGKTGIWSDSQVAKVGKDITYFAVDLEEICRRSPVLIRSMLLELMGELEAGALRPLPQLVFPIEQTADAFKAMARAQHIGKIVISQQKSTSRPAANLRVEFRPDSTYLITGGLGGPGLLVARWMAERGARSLVLLGRRGPSAAVREKINELEQLGMQVLVARADVTAADEVAGVLAEIDQSMPPLRGVIHSAGALNNGVLAQQSWDRFGDVLGPKVAGAWNLHTLMREKALDFFVLFSSAASLFGSPGQGNHSAANAFLDALAHHRHAQGLPALSINWGAWKEIGAAAERGADERAMAGGVGAISPARGLLALEEVFRRDVAQIAVTPINWAQFLQLPSLAEQKFFEEFFKKDHPTGFGDDSSAEHHLPTKLAIRLKEASPSERHNLLVESIRAQVAKILGIAAIGTLDPNRPLSELGVDSLMAVEIRNALANAVGHPLSASLIFDHPTIAALADHLLEEVLSLQAPALSDPELPPESPIGLDAILAQIEHLSDKEAETLLQNRH